VRTLFVGNIDFGVTEADLEFRFAEFGQVQEVHVLRDAAGESRGMAIVEMATATACEKALVLGGFLWFGRWVYMRPRRSRRPKTQSKFRRTHWPPTPAPWLSRRGTGVPNG